MLTHLEERLRWQIQNSWSPFMMLWSISTDKTYSFIDAVENWQPTKKNPSYIYHCGRGLYSSRGIIQNVPNGHSLITSHTLLGYKAANDQHASRWRRHVVVPYARQIERYSYIYSSRQQAFTAPDCTPPGRSTPEARADACQCRRAPSTYWRN